MNIKPNILTKAALLLSLALLCQSLRLIFPLPPMINMFVIGSLVNAILVLGAWQLPTGVMYTIATILPIVAFIQGQLPLPIFIPVVILGNIIYILLCARFANYKWLQIVAAIAKTATICIGATLTVAVFSLPKVITAFIWTMSIGQVVTATIGVILARMAEKLIRV